jgi:hypothetical protein
LVKHAPFLVSVFIWVKFVLLHSLAFHFSMLVGCFSFHGKFGLSGENLRYQFFASQIGLFLRFGFQQLRVSAVQVAAAVRVFSASFQVHFFESVSVSSGLSPFHILASSAVGCGKQVSLSAFLRRHAFQSRFSVSAVIALLKFLCNNGARFVRQARRLVEGGESCRSKSH